MPWFVTFVDRGSTGVARRSSRSFPNLDVAMPVFSFEASQPSAIFEASDVSCRVIIAIPKATRCHKAGTLALTKMGKHLSGY